MTLTPTLMLGAITIAMCSRVRGDLGLLRVAEAGRADHRLDAEFAAHRQVRQRAFGAGEVDQHLRVGQAGAQVGVIGTPLARPRKAAASLADRRAAGDVERAGQHAVGARGDGLDQHAAHAAGGAGDGDPAQRRGSSAASLMSAARAAGSCAPAPAGRPAVRRPAASVGTGKRLDLLVGQRQLAARCGRP